MWLPLLVQLFYCVYATHFHEDGAPKHDSTDSNDEPTIDKKMEQMQKQIDALSRQLMLQQFYAQQRVRTDGNSGLKQIRVTTTGFIHSFIYSFIRNIYFHICRSLEL